MARRSFPLNPNRMWNHQIVIFLRQLRKFRVAHSINLLGLAIGLACCLVSFLHIRYELSYDTDLPNSDRLFRIVNGDPSTSDAWVKTAATIPPKIKAEIPEVESFVRFNSVTYADKVAVAYGEKVLLEPFFMMADPNFFDAFGFPVSPGTDPSQLTNLSNVLVSRSAANRLFGSEDPVGKTIRLTDYAMDFTVAGTFPDLPANTHLRCDYLISFENLDRLFGKGSLESWGQYNYFGYLLLYPSADPDQTLSKIRKILVDRPGQSQVSFAELFLQRIQRIHFEGNRGNLLPSYDERYLYIFGTLAIAVLVICVMNFVNNSAMLSLRRIREIGVRKSVGATSFQLNRQFFYESISVVMISFFGALVLVFAFSPLLGSLLGSPLDLPMADLTLWGSAIGVLAILVLASVAHLTSYVNRLRPGDVLKGFTPTAGRGKLFQNGLLFLQFSLSLILVLGAVVVVQQVRHLQNKNLGFDKEQVIQVVLPRGTDPSVLRSMQTLAGQSGLIESGSFSDFVPGRPNWNQTTWWEGQTEPESMNVIVADREFVHTLKIDLVEGNPQEITEAKEVQYLINESARQYIGWEEARGKFLSPFGEQQKKPIAGVVHDFNFRSLHNPIVPLVLAIFPERSFNKWYVRIKGGEVQAGIEAIHNAYQASIPSMPFEFVFLDDAINQLYVAELRMEKIIVLLTSISVCFALLGIFTLISFTIEYRTREIAIRKVIGISLSELVQLFTRDYLRLVLAAGVIAIPLCWKLATAWLSHFDEKVTPQVWVFILAVIVLGVLVVGVGLAKYLSLQRINPAIALKRE